MGPDDDAAAGLVVTVSNSPAAGPVLLFGWNYIYKNISKCTFLTDGLYFGQILSFALTCSTLDRCPFLVCELAFDFMMACWVLFLCFSSYRSSPKVVSNSISNRLSHTFLQRKLFHSSLAFRPETIRTPLLQRTSCLHSVYEPTPSPVGATSSDVAVMFAAKTSLVKVLSWKSSKRLAIFSPPWAWFHTDQNKFTCFIHLDRQVPNFSWPNKP